MGLVVLTNTAVAARFVLICDPSIQAANEVEALRRYIETRDPACLVIPDDSTWVEALPLDRRAVCVAEAQAHINKGAAAFVSAERVLRRHEAIVRACCVSLSDLPQLKRDASGYPVERLWELLPDAESVIVGIASHIEAVSTLGKAHAPSSTGSRGPVPAIGSTPDATSAAPALTVTAGASATSGQPESSGTV
jgi:hypothetical protein